MAMTSVPDGKEGLGVGEVREEETVVEKGAGVNIFICIRNFSRIVILPY